MDIYTTFSICRSHESLRLLRANTSCVLNVTQAYYLILTLVTEDSTRRVLLSTLEHRGTGACQGLMAEGGRLPLSWHGGRGVRDIGSKDLDAALKTKLSGG